MNLENVCVFFGGELKFCIVFVNILQDKMRNNNLAASRPLGRLTGRIFSHFLIGQIRWASWDSFSRVEWINNGSVPVKWNLHWFRSCWLLLELMINFLILSIFLFFDACDTFASLTAQALFSRCKVFFLSGSTNDCTESYSLFNTDCFLHIQPTLQSNAFFASAELQIPWLTKNNCMFRECRRLVCATTPSVNVRAHRNWTGRRRAFHTKTSCVDLLRCACIGQRAILFGAQENEWQHFPVGIGSFFVSAQERHSVCISFDARQNTQMRLGLDWVQKAAFIVLHLVVLTTTFTFVQCMIIGMRLRARPNWMWKCWYSCANAVSFHELKLEILYPSQSTLHCLHHRPTWVNFPSPSSCKTPSPCISNVTQKSLPNIYRFFAVEQKLQQPRFPNLKSVIRDQSRKSSTPNLYMLIQRKDCRPLLITVTWYCHMTM